MVEKKKKRYADKCIKQGYLKKLKIGEILESLDNLVLLCNYIIDLRKS